MFHCRGFVSFGSLRRCLGFHLFSGLNSHVGLGLTCRCRFLALAVAADFAPFLGLEQRSHSVRRLGALANPILDPLHINAKLFLIALGYRVKEAQSLYIAAVTTITTVRDHQVVKRAFFRTGARKTNTDHFNSVRFSDRQACLRSGAGPSKARILLISC